MLGDRKLECPRRCSVARSVAQRDPESGESKIAGVEVRSDEPLLSGRRTNEARCRQVELRHSKVGRCKQFHLAFNIRSWCIAFHVFSLAHLNGDALRTSGFVVGGIRKTNDAVIRLHRATDGGVERLLANAIGETI